MLTLIKTGHPEEGRALSSLAPARRPLYVFVFVEERQSQEAARRVHQSSERGAPAAGSLECAVERNLYCPIVPLFPRSHHTPARPVHLQVRSANQACIPFHGRILSSAATLAGRQHLCAHTRRCTAYTEREVIKTDLGGRGRGVSCSQTRDWKWKSEVNTDGASLTVGRRSTSLKGQFTPKIRNTYFFLLPVVLFISLFTSLFRNHHTQ